ncbi:glycosyltransferase family 2 protein [Nocardioides zeae]|uniref:Glycosyltransferase family 2 protein n=1 Tax=Nocardioides imazamoxiresistens TaxID=3231893 RepID=A0ABU3PW63_9ACTN|nr:glycosyltransferase family 2 protein [Nocardioides zeae]MDT9593462.1 glycosyltransferase family 2 protein [Nocardioides zeae]
MSPTGDAAAAGATDTPRVSVIMPVRDVGEWIGETMESIRGQSMASWELIVVDDGSQDDTPDQVAALAATDPRVRLERNPGAGGATARNHGVSLARGDFLAFADGDDVVPRDAYRVLVDQADATGAEMVVGNHVVVEPQRLTSRDQSLRVYDRVRTGLTIRDDPRLLRDRVCWNRVVRRSSWEALELEFATSRRSNDILAMTEAYCALEFDVVPTPVYAYRRRVGTTSMTSGKHQPGALRDHFTQELACVAAVRRLDDAGVLKQFYAGILQFDIWAHGVVALERDEPEFDEVRQLLVELVTGAPAASLRGLPAFQRLVYQLVVRRAWGLARAVVGATGPHAAEQLTRPDVLGVVSGIAHSDRALAQPLGEVLERVFLQPLVETPYALSDEQVRDLFDRALAFRDAAGIAGALRGPVRRLLDGVYPHPAMLRAAARGLEAREASSMSVERRLRKTVRAFRKDGPRAGLGELARTARHVRPRHLVAAARRVERRQLEAGARKGVRTGVRVARRVVRR